MERTVPNVPFAAGSYSIAVSVEGPATQQPGFAATLDDMFGLWATIMVVAVRAINILVRTDSRRGEDFIQATEHVITSRLGDDTITLSVTFNTDTEGLTEPSIRVILTGLSRFTGLVLNSFNEGTTSRKSSAQVSFGKLFGPSPFPGGWTVVDAYYYPEVGDPLDPFSFSRRRGHWTHPGEE